MTKIEYIPNEDKVFRLVNKAFYSEKKQKISERAFAMREGEDGLSVDWNKNNSPEQTLERLNRTYKKGTTEF